MRLGRVFCVCILVLSTAVVVHADGLSATDPTMLLGRGLASPDIKMLAFAAAPGPNGGGILDFDNMTGQDWIGLIMTVTFQNAPEASAFASSCNSGEVSSSIFSNPCGNLNQHGNKVTFTLTGGVITACSSSPCSTNSEFFVDLNDGDSLKLHSHANNNGKGGWKGDSIQIQAITAPEPASLLLLLRGLGGVLLARKRG